MREIAVRLRLGRVVDVVHAPDVGGRGAPEGKQALESGGRRTLNGAGNGAGVDRPRAYVLDVLVDGTPVRRSTRVELDGSVLRFDDQELDLTSIFWVSRRAGLVLMFAQDRTLAVLGKSSDLAEVARAVERGSNRAEQRRLLQPLTNEVVVCAAGTAVSGNIDRDRVSGLHLAVFTQRGLHLVAGDRRYSVPWPVEAAAEIPAEPREPGRGGLTLKTEGVSLRLRYLFPEEIQAVIRVATAPPRARAARQDAIEMFARGEVAPPPPARLPEFAISVETLQEACVEGASRVRVPSIPGPGVGPDFFARHFQELGEIALGPLMLRKSAAAGAGSLARAVEAMDAEKLRQDTRAALQAATERLFQVYGTQVERLLSERRPDQGAAARLRAIEAERGGLDRSLEALIDELEPSFARVLARQHLLLQRLHALEHGPPDAEQGQVEEAAEEWRSEIVKLDRSYGAAWRRLLSEIADLWSEGLLPRLGGLAALPRRRISKRARLAILAGATLVLVASAVLLIR